MKRCSHYLMEFRFPLESYGEKWKIFKPKAKKARSVFWKESLPDDCQVKWNFLKGYQVLCLSYEIKQSKMPGGPATEVVLHSQTFILTFTGDSIQNINIHILVPVSSWCRTLLWKRTLSPQWPWQNRPEKAFPRSDPWCLLWDDPCSSCTVSLRSARRIRSYWAVTWILLARMFF